VSTASRSRRNRGIFGAISDLRFGMGLHGLPLEIEKSTCKVLHPCRAEKCDEGDSCIHQQPAQICWSGKSRLDETFKDMCKCRSLMIDLSQLDELCGHRWRDSCRNEVSLDFFRPNAIDSFCLRERNMLTTGTFHLRLPRPRHYSSHRVLHSTNTKKAGCTA
jgi:hypothetical protein